ncbi:MAG TPA: hypothetical protein VGS99_05040 [Gammaproteobacteria bacterium]|nr:hypothetical protein [Gammaproteobacteria bacterium]
MKAGIRACWDILLLRRPPQIFPKSWLLFGAFLEVYFGTDFLTFLAQGIDVLPALRMTVVDTGLSLSFLTLLMFANFVPQRLNQVFSAWLGAGILLNLISIPVSVVDALSRVPLLSDFTFFLNVLILAWTMAVMAHILRHSLQFRPVLGLDLSLGFGLVIAGVYVIVDMTIFYTLFPH